MTVHSQRQIGVDRDWTYAIPMDIRGKPRSHGG
jgi:hypothetical protein